MFNLMETIYFTYWGPLEFEIQIKHITIDDIYTKFSTSNSISIHKLIGIDEETSLDFRGYSYDKVIDELKIYYFKQNIKITFITITNYDPYDPKIARTNSIKWDVNGKDYEFQLLGTCNPQQNIKSNIYAQHYGLTMYPKNYEQLIHCAKLEYVNKIIAKEKLNLFTDLELPNLKNITCHVTSHNLDSLLKFTQINTLVLKRESDDFFSVNTYLYKYYTNFINLLNNFEKNLTTLDLHIVTTRDHQNQTLELFDIFTNNTTLTSLTYNANIYGHQTYLDPIYDSNLKSKIYNLLSDNTTLTYLKLVTTIDKYDYGILNLIKNNTTLTHINLSHFQNRLSVVQNNDESLCPVDSHILDFIECRHENLPILEFRFVGIVCYMLFDFLINKYYYLTNLNKIINELLRVKNNMYMYKIQPRENVGLYLRNHSKYNVSLSTLARVF